MRLESLGVGCGSHDEGDGAEGGWRRVRLVAGFDGACKIEENRDTKKMPK